MKALIVGYTLFITISLLMAPLFVGFYISTAIKMLILFIYPLYVWIIFMSATKILDWVGMD